VTLIDALPIIVILVRMLVIPVIASSVSFRAILILRGGILCKMSVTYCSRFSRAGISDMYQKVVGNNNRDAVSASRWCRVRRPGS
jgi:hypothetical protein